MDEQKPTDHAHSAHDLFIKIERELKDLRVIFGIAIIIVALILTAMVVFLSPGFMTSRFNPYLDQAAMPTYSVLDSSTVTATTSTSTSPQ